MSYNIEQPITGELAAAKANKGGDDITNPATWRTNLDVPNTLDSRRRAMAGAEPGLSFDGNTSGTRVTSTMTGQTIGTGDFSVWTRFRCPASVPASGNGSLPGIWALSDSASGTFRANAILLYLDSANQLRLFRYGATPASDNRMATITGFVTAWAGQVVDVVVTRSGNTVKLYVNGTDTAFSEISAGTAPTWGSSIVSDFFNVGMQSAANIFGDRIYRAVLFNRALSQADVNAVIVNGVAEADQWGTQTAAYSSNFASGADGWSFVRATVTGNVDAILGVDDTLRIVPDTSPGTTHYIHNTTVPGMATGKRYRLGFSYYVPGGNAVANGLQMWQGGIAGSVTGVLNTTGAWTNISPVEFVATSSRLDLLATSSGNTNFTGNGTDALYAKSFVLTRIGALVDLNFRTGTGATAYDNSSNALHGAIVGGVSWIVPATAQTVAPAGTAAAPGITTAGDTDTGVSFPAANTMALNTGGVERARVKAGGQVRFIPLASAPAGAEIGDVYYDSTTNRLTVFTNAGWASITHTVV